MIFKLFLNEKNQVFFFFFLNKEGCRQTVPTGKTHNDFDVVQQSVLRTTEPGRCHEGNSLLLNRGPLKMHGRFRLCIFNEVCLKYLIASCSFGKQIRLFPLIFDAEISKCKTHTLISPFLSIVSVCCRLDVSTQLAPHRKQWHADGGKQTSGRH